MNTAWMIRNDGKIFPCVQHIDANPENVGATLLAAQWLYANTRHEESRQLALETAAAWMASVSADENALSPISDSISDGSLSQAFIKAHAGEMKAIPIENLHLTRLCNEITSELNQEFLRAEYGGVSHTDASSKELFFRISSVGFDWYNILHHFITAADFPIESILIVREEDSTGAESKLHLRLPTETFLAEQPMQLTPPSLSSLRGGVMVREIFAHLSYGSSLRHISWDLMIDASGLSNALTVLSDWENQRGFE